MGGAMRGSCEITIAHARPWESVPTDLDIQCSLHSWEGNPTRLSARRDSFTSGSHACSDSSPIYGSVQIDVVSASGGAASSTHVPPPHVPAHPLKT